MKDQIIDKIAERFDEGELGSLYGDIIGALHEAFEAGVKSVEKAVKEDVHLPALLRPAPLSDTAKRMRELAGIPHKGNFV